MSDRLNDHRKGDKIYTMILDTNGEEAAAALANEQLGEWAETREEGKLTVDVAQTDDTIVVIAPMAGVLIDRIEVNIHNDLLTIRGTRATPLEGFTEIDYYYQECFWGRFSRTIVLPVDVKGDLAQAEYKNGVLKITIPKQRLDARIPVKIVEE